MPGLTHEKVPENLEYLQRAAGNQAVTELIQRQVASPTASPAAASPPATATPAVTPLWLHGPTTTRKSVGHTLDEYIGWVREVEAAYSGRENAAQRLRRLYYSDFVSSQLKARGQKPGAGSLFDKTISTSGAGEAPLESPPISQAALDGLFETDTIATPAGFTVDVAHIWADLDLAIAGKTAKASAGWFALGADFQGVLTWSGDLASWFVEFVTRIRKMTGKLRMPDAGNMADLDKALGLNADALLMSLVNSKVSKEDLVSDFDAQAIVKENVTPGHVYGGTPTANLADMLENYYKPSKLGPAPELSRFAAFVKAARPEIPYDVDPAAPSGIRLSSKATSAVLEALYSTAEVLLTGTQGHNVTPASDLEFVLLKIARRFTEFLATGLEKGDAPWP